MKLDPLSSATFKACHTSKVLWPKKRPEQWACFREHCGCPGLMMDGNLLGDPPGKALTLQLYCAGQIDCQRALNLMPWQCNQTVHIGCPLWNTCEIWVSTQSHGNFGVPVKFGSALNHMVPLEHLWNLGQHSVTVQRLGSQQSLKTNCAYYTWTYTYTVCRWGKMIIC